MSVISAVGLTAPANLTLDHPIVGWHTLVTPSNVAATMTDANYPASNLANPATNLKWKASAQPSPPVYNYITVVFSASESINYVAIAKHNLGTSAIPVSIGYWNTASPPVWTELIADTLLGDDGPAIFRFATQSRDQISVRLGAVAGTPEIAILNVGTQLILPRKLYQGMAPITYARVAKVTSGRSEMGSFLGRIVLQEFVKNTVPLSLIDPTYFRSNIAAFLTDSKENPFFFAWRPLTYPAEVGFCHMTNDPVPVNEAPHGLIAMSLEMTGII